jgi:lysophospholipase L1-like esterase
MKTVTAVLFALLVCAATGRAEPTGICAVPGYLLFGDSPLPRVSAAVNRHRTLKVVVLGTTSATLPGPDGAGAAFPARLEAALKRRLPDIATTVLSLAKPRQTAAQMAETVQKLLVDEKPNLVVWQTGTFDATRGIDPEEFRSSVADGVEALHEGGADVVLMNMQYSPRTESVLAFGAHADSLRWVARAREVPLFDRLAIMRNWNDTGAIDLYVATKDVGMAKRVHDCIGRALATLVIDAAHLEALEKKSPQ